MRAGFSIAKAQLAVLLFCFYPYIFMAQKISPLYALIIPVVGIILTGVFIVARNSGKFGELKNFDYATYRSNWETLQGNEYKIRGEVVQQLSQRDDKGRVLAVKLLDGPGRVPVFIPASIRQNFETGQRFRFHVYMRKDVLYAEGVEKF